MSSRLKPLLDLDPADVRRARTLARKAGRPVVKLAQSHTTVSVERATLRLAGLEGADTEDWRRMIHTNVLGLMYVTHAALPHLLETKGSLVQVSSVAGRVARVGSGAYNASKWAVNAFSESLRQEVTARGVRVVLIEPGMVATELGDHITDQGAKAALQQRREQMTPMEADDIARAVLYAVTQPPHVAVNEILIRPTDQEQ